MIELTGEKLADFELVSRLEWLETNGLGGWASSTVSGAHTRRYHALLVAAARPPVDREVLVSRLDETLLLDGGRVELGCNCYPGVVHPEGYRHLAAFRRDVFVQLEYRVGGVRLLKTIAGLLGEGTTAVLYEIAEASGPVRLELRPFLTWRPIHSLGPATALSQQVEVEGDTVRYRAAAHAPQVWIRVPGASFQGDADWYHRFQYPREHERGLDFEEDLWSPGSFAVTLEPGHPLGVLLSTTATAGRDALALVEAERERREDALGPLAGKGEPARTLGLAADQFLVRRGDGGATVIAGYHWFTDWGRDTMIALPGLCLATGREEVAGRILRAWAASVDEGMLPNRFPDGGEAPEYNTVDATLWFFVAVHRYLEATGDEELVRSDLLPVLREIVEWNDRGTRFGIRVAEDGLLEAGEAGVQLTWMDARVAGEVITPRMGKPVEVEALWCNALAILAELEASLGSEERAQDLRARFERARRRFAELFWNPHLGCLYDVIGPDGPDPAVRPNQVFALSLPHVLLDDARGREVLTVVESLLLTPVGLRSLSPNHPAYRGTYTGDPASRDRAYHQGTVWGWLLGPYLSALIRLRGQEGRRQAAALLRSALEQLRGAGVGTCSEIFDGDPPHTPRGCIAQAWTVAELLRVLSDDLVGELADGRPQRGGDG
jgi:predicted glycogen debranching enzyme